MALDLSTAQAVHPRAVPISAISPSAPFATRLGIPFAKPFAPRSAPASALAPLTGAGVTLTRYVLLIVFVMLLFFMGGLAFQEYRFGEVAAANVRSAVVSFNSPTADATRQVEQLRARQELMKAYLEMANASRDFWSKMAQMILLNLLLPVLTALLGYVFASKSSGK